jgi:serine/threonine protein kinase
VSTPDDLNNRDAAEDPEENPAVRRALEELERIGAFHRKLISSAPDERPVAPSSPPASTFSVSTPSAPAPLLRWGKLEVQGKLGEGVFGEVYLAHDPDLRRDVALKLYKREIDGSGWEKGQQRDFLREARLMAKVQHRNVVAIHSVEVRNRRVGIEMELVQGETLAEILRRQVRLRADEASLIGIDLCRALASLHAQGVVHRDLKPENVIREAGGRVVLMDLGVGLDTTDPSASGLGGGSPLYMPPEALSGGRPKPSSDVYSLGVLLFHLVTGRWPVEAHNLYELITRHEKGERQPLASLNADLPPAFVAVVEKALSVDPAKRYRTAGEMAGALTAALEGRPLPQRTDLAPRWVVLTLAAVAVAAALLAVWAIGSRRFDRYRPEDPRISRAMAERKIGEYRLHVGNYREAAAFFEEARHELKSASAHNHPEMAMVLFDLGGAYGGLNRLADARSAFGQCLDLQRKLYDADDPSIASTLSDLANVCEELGDMTAAQSYYRQASEVAGLRLTTPEQNESGETETASTRPDSSAGITSTSAGSGVGLRRSQLPVSPWASYTYQAEFLGVDQKAKVFVPLRAGDNVRAGDFLAMRFRASIPLYVYVVTRDLEGHEYGLFPLSGLSVANPIPADSDVVFPGAWKGRRQAWQADCPGGEERFLVVTSPTRIAEMEEMVASMARPSPGAAISRVPLSANAGLRLRGIGGLGDIAVDSVVGTEAASQGLESYMANAGVLSDSTERASGISFRRFWLKNP